MRASTGCQRTSPLCSIPGPTSDLGQRDALLPLVLATAVLVRGLAHLIGLEEDHLRDAFVGVDLRGQRRRVGELERDEALPFGLKRRYVYDDSAVTHEDAGFQREVARLRRSEAIHVVLAFDVAYRND